MAPETTSRPPSSITTWSHTCCTSSSRWVASSTEMPKPPRRATRASISSRPIGSRPAVGSSSSTSSGSATIAWASLVRWRMPVEKPPTGRKRASSRPTRSSTSEARWRAARGGEPAQLAEGGDDVGGRLVEREAVVLGHVAEAAAHADRVGWPRRRRTPRGEPEVGWLSPSIIRNRVVLPAPLAPDQAHAAGRDLEVEAVDGRHARVPLGQPPRAEERGGSGPRTAVCQAGDVAFARATL